jgi:hypothetical protein
MRGIKPFPVVDTGELLRSPTVEDDDVGAILEVAAEHGTYQEFGTGPAGEFGGAPFTPPLEALQAWGRRKKRRSGTKRKGKGGRKGSARKKDQDRGEGKKQTPEQREKAKKSRAAAKAKRDALADKEGDAFGAAVWANMSKKGMKGKRYYALASAFFGDDVSKFVGRAIGKVRR